MTISIVRIIGAGMLSLALVGTAGTALAQKKGHPESRTGHGQAADQRLIKNPYPAGCSSAAQTTVNKATGESTQSCRGTDGMIKILKGPSK